ncbi:hypothetical protein [Dactylosporangium sp. NPDC048998]|uniref:hypothetical protein n=1 Tax=Dactylosporangium sp. NPDC048998 TaxID=3363976 RepID=UPI00371673C2
MSTYVDWKRNAEQALTGWRGFSRLPNHPHHTVNGKARLVRLSRRSATVAAIGAAAVFAVAIAPYAWANGRIAETGTVRVSTTAELQAALAAAKPGQTIKLAPGTYRGSFLTR